MKKVITYGTYDLLHFGHIRLLERAKALGDYLIVGVTSDDFDISRGKINVQQSLMERIEAVRATGLADEIVVEQYEGQKIDDIQKYGVDIFTVGSDWVGYFDYLNEYCQVVYLDRTKGVSSTELRSKEAELRVGLIGDSDVVVKFARESKFANGVCISGIVSDNLALEGTEWKRYQSYKQLVQDSDALYVASHPSRHYKYVKMALEAGKHVVYESPLALVKEEAEELFALAEKNNCILYASMKTAYSIAYARMILMAKTGKIGDIVSVDAVCTSLSDMADCKNLEDYSKKWNSITAWGPTAMLPVFQLLGTEHCDRRIVQRMSKVDGQFDEFTKVDWIYPHAVASIKVAKGAKAEGQLVITGTKGYIYVPAPWWKTDYFEIRYEDQSQNKRFFYQLDGEGIRNMIASFVKSITKHKLAYISEKVSVAIVNTIEACQSDEVKHID